MSAADEIRNTMDELTDIFEAGDECASETTEKMAPKKNKDGTPDHSRKNGKSFPEKKGFVG